jgi:hypothetical protein
VKVSCERGELAARMSDGMVTFAPMLSADHPCVP